MKSIWKRGLLPKALGLIAAITLLLVPLTGCSGRVDAKEKAADPTYVDVTVGNIEDIITATGNVAPKRKVALTFDVMGTVNKVAVEDGDTVQAGQVLARLDNDDLQDAVERAKVSLRTAQANLKRARTSATEAEIAAAEASVASAKANLAKLYEEPTALERQQAKLDIDSAKDQLWSKQAQRDAVCGRVGRGATDADCDSAKAAVLVAEVAVQQAQVRQQMLDEPPKAADVAQAQAQVDQAKANLQQLLEKPRAEDIAIQEAQVAEVQLNLAQAKEALADDTLVAPFAGTITAVNVEEGENVSTSTPAMTLLDSKQLQVNARIDEMDVARVNVGQDARLSFAALDDKTIDGKVTDVAVAATETSSGMAYGAEISLAQEDAPIKPGMTADVEIVVERAEGVVLVPNQAITEEREKGLYFVTKKTVTGSQRVPVKLGIRSETYSQVLSGVKKGDQVQLIVGTQNNGGEQTPEMPFGGHPGGRP